MSESTPHSPPETSVNPNKGSAPELAWNVTKYHIVITRVWVKSAQLSAEDNPPPSPDELEPLKLSGQAGESREESFFAFVDWQLPPPSTRQPFRASGTIGMEFSHKPGLHPQGVEYYSQVNAPILAYPYIRQLIAQLTCGHPCGPLVVRPLDVPKFVADAKGTWASQYLEKLKLRPQESSQSIDGASSDNGT